MCAVMRAQKRSAVQHLLCTSWPQLIQTPGAVRRLTEDLCVPSTWVAEARAWWAAAHWDTRTEVRRPPHARLGPRTAK